MKHKWEGKYHNWGTKKPKSIKGRTHKTIKKYFDSEQPGQKFVKRVDGKTKELEVFYPEHLSREEVEAQLAETIEKTNKKNKIATSIFGIGLPIAITVDVLTIGALFTIFDALALGISATALSRGLKVKRLVNPKVKKGEQEPPQKKVDLVPNSTLEHYREVENSGFSAGQAGIPTDEQIEQLCVELGHPEMAKTVKKVRDRQIRELEKLQKKADKREAKRARKNGTAPNPVPVTGAASV